MKMMKMMKMLHGDISGTKSGIVDPLVSIRPEKILNKKFKNKKTMLYISTNDIARTYDVA